MLTILELPSLACKRTIWETFDPNKSHWIVSDVKSKLFLTRDLLSRNSLLVGHPVMRSSEFWRELLGKSFSDFIVLGKVGAQLMARKYLEEAGPDEWCSRPNAPSRLLNNSRTAVSLVAHPLAESIIEDFMATFEGECELFVSQVQMATSFYRYCLKLKRLPSFFVPSFLSQFDQKEQGCQIIFDLGLQITEGERDLIQALSKQNDVVVLVPRFERSTPLYKDLSLGVASRKISVPEGLAPVRDLSIWHCSSPDSEARKAVEHISKLVKSGIKPSRICVTAPDIRIYESLLSHDLKWEGVSFARTLTAPLSASRAFRALLHRLRIVNGELSLHLLEEAFLSVSAYALSQQRRREQRTLAPISSVEQIPIDAIKREVQKLRSFNKSENWTLSDFEDLAIKIFEKLSTEEDTNRQFIRALQNLRAEIGPQDLTLELWIEAFAEVFKSIDVPLHAAAREGVWAVNLSYCDEVPADHLIVLGVNEEKPRFSLLDHLKDQHLKHLWGQGFHFAEIRESSTDRQLRWLQTGSWPQMIMSSSQTDARGQTVSPHSVWLEWADNENKEVLDVAKDTNWVRLQKSLTTIESQRGLDKVKNWNEGRATRIAEIIKMELESTREIKLETLQDPFLPISLSASRIESYAQCPFKFFSTVHLGLFDEPDLDIEPSPQSKGRWLHAAAEKILASDLNQWDEKAVLDLVDTLDPIQMQVASDVWPSLRARIAKTIKRFIEFEIKWQGQYTKSKPTHFEARVEGFLAWTPNDEALEFKSAQPSEKISARFRGIIDRVDLTESDQAIVIDYKSSGSPHSSIKSWNSQSQFQLALYAQALEAGFFEGRPLKTIAAQYYSLKKLRRDKGFQMSDEPLEEILPQTAKSGRCDSELREKYFSEINKSLKNILESVRQGHFTPRPKKEAICNSCSWNLICRAHHLS